MGAKWVNARGNSSGDKRDTYVRMQVSLVQLYQNDFKVPLKLTWVLSSSKSSFFFPPRYSIAGFVFVQRYISFNYFSFTHMKAINTIKYFDSVVPSERQVFFCQQEKQ